MLSDGHLLKEEFSATKTAFDALVPYVSDTNPAD
jgi:hypothetical protein